MSVAIADEESVQRHQQHSFVPQPDQNLNPDSYFDTVHSYNSCLTSAFLFVNFTLFLAFTSLNFFSAVREELLSFFGVLFGVAAFGIMVGYGFKPARVAISELKKGVLSFEALIVMNVLVMCVLTAWWAYSDIYSFGVNLQAEYLIVSGFLAFLVLHIRNVIWHRLTSILSYQTLARDQKIILLASDRTEVAKEFAENGKVVKLSELSTGDIILLKKGDIIPLDATVIDGTANVYERQLTLKGYRMQKQAGNDVFAGSKILSGELTCKVVSLPAESRITSFFTGLRNLKTTNPSNARSVYSLLVLAITVVCSLYWLDQGMLRDYFEPVVGSFLALALISEWFEIRRLLLMMKENQLLSEGVIAKSSAEIEQLQDLEEVVIRSNLEPGFANWKATKIEILDDRLESKSILSVMYSVFSQASSIYNRSVLKKVCEQIGSDFEPPEVSDIIEYPDQGVAFNFQGAEFSIGSEDFLLARGVHLSSNELQTEDSEAIFIALQDSLVALIHFEQVYPNLYAASKQAGVRSRFSSQLPQEKIDEYGKKCGYDLVLLKGEQSAVEAIRTLPTTAKTAIFCENRLDLEDLPANTMSIMPFNHLLFDPRQSEISIVDGDLSGFFDCIVRLRSLSLIDKVLSYGAVGILMLLAFPVALGLVPSELSLLFVAGLFTALGVVLSQRIKGFLNTI